MTKKTDGKKDFTKNDLIKILNKVDAERINRHLKEGSFAQIKIKNISAYD